MVFRLERHCDRYRRGTFINGHSVRGSFPKTLAIGTGSLAAEVPRGVAAAGLEITLGGGVEIRHEAGHTGHRADL